MERGGRVMKTCGTFGQSSSSSSLRTHITHLDSTPRSGGDMRAAGYAENMSSCSHGNRASEAGFWCTRTASKI